MAAQRGRLILWLPVMLGVGSALYFALRFEPLALFSGTAVAGLLLAVGLLWPWRQGEAAQRIVWVVLLLLAWLAIGFAGAQWRTLRLQAPMIAKPVKFADVTGTVAEVEILEEGDGQRLILTDLSIEDMKPQDTPRKVRLKIRDNDKVNVGARVQVLAALNPPSAPVMPGAFDFQRYAYFRQIGAFGYTFKPLKVLSTTSQQGWAARAEDLRQNIVARLDQGMSAQGAAFAAALMIGERGAISEDDWNAMRGSGLAHMLSISGMHVGLVAGAVFFTVRLLLALLPFIALRVPIKKVAAFTALAAAAFYTLLAVMLDRKPFSMRTIALAALLVLLAVPESIWSASFQMSFAATAALIFFFEETAPLWIKWRREAGFFRRCLLYITGVCATTIVAGTATAPFAIYHFQQYTVFGTLANLLAVPVLSFIVMPAIIVAFILLPFGWQAPALWVMQHGISLIALIAHDVADMPHSQIVVASWPMGALVLVTLAALTMMLWVGRMRFAVSAIMGLLAVVTIMNARLPDLIVADDAGLISVRTTDNRLSLSSARKDKFAAGIWLRHNGLDADKALYWPREGEGPGGMTCDIYGCRTTVNQKNIAFSLRPESLAEDCAWADIVIARSPLRAKDCRSAQMVVDRIDLWRHGAYALWLDGAPRAVSVDEVRGNRPWTVSSRR